MHASVANPANKKNTLWKPTSGIISYMHAAPKAPNPFKTEDIVVVADLNPMSSSCLDRSTTTAEPVRL